MKIKYPWAHLPIQNQNITNNLHLPTHYLEFVIIPLLFFFGFVTYMHTPKKHILVFLFFLTERVSLSQALAKKKIVIKLYN